MLEILLASNSKIDYTEFFVPSNRGKYVAGGFFSGACITDGARRFALIVGPKSNEVTASAMGLTIRSTVNDVYNGKKNTNAHRSANTVTNNYFNALTINEFSDWHIPSIQEYTAWYTQLKPSTDANDGAISNAANQSNIEPNVLNPSQTSITEFQLGNEGFSNLTYLSSDGALFTPTTGVRSYPASTTTTDKYVRLVRWVEVDINGTPIAGVDNDIEYEFIVTTNYAGEAEYMSGYIVV